MKRDPLSSVNVLALHAPIPEKAMLAVTMPARLAFEKLRTGCGEEDDYHTLYAAAQICLARVANTDMLDIAESAVHAMGRVWGRFQAGKAFGFDADGLRCLTDMLDLYDELNRKSTPKQMMDAMRVAAKRMEVKL